MKHRHWSLALTASLALTGGAAAQQAAARKFWTKVIAEAKRESQAKATPTPEGGDDD